MGLWDYDSDEEVLGASTATNTAHAEKRHLDELPEALAQDSDDEHGLRAQLVRGKRRKPATAAAAEKPAAGAKKGQKAAATSVVQLQVIQVAEEGDDSHPSARGDDESRGLTTDEWALTALPPRLTSFASLKTWLKPGSTGALNKNGSACLTSTGSIGASAGASAHGAPAAVAQVDQAVLSAETRAQLARCQQLVANMGTLARSDDDEDEPPPAAPQGHGTSTVAGAAPVRGRPVEVLQRLQKELTVAQEQQLQASVVISDSDDEGTGTESAGMAARLAGLTDPNKKQLELKHRHGSFHVRVRPSDTVSRLALAFVHVTSVQQQPPKQSVPMFPTDPARLRLQFDGESLPFEMTVEDAGIEDGDVVDVTWKA